MRSVFSQAIIVILCVSTGVAVADEAGRRVPVPTQPAPEPPASVGAAQAVDTSSRGSGPSTSPVAVPIAASSPAAPLGPKMAKAEVVKLVDRLARQYGLDRDLAHAFVDVESHYDPHFVSSTGAIGLMQIQPRVAIGLGVDGAERLFEPETNLRAGLSRLKALVDEHGSIGRAVIAYIAIDPGLGSHEDFSGSSPVRAKSYRVLTAFLSKKGIAPFSMRATSVLGMEMKRDERDVSAKLPNDTGALPNDHHGWMTGVAPSAPGVANVDTAPGQLSHAQAQRRGPTLLSSRLSQPRNSLLRSRLEPTVQPSARQSVRGVGLRGLSSRRH